MFIFFYKNLLEFFFYERPLLECRMHFEDENETPSGKINIGLLTPISTEELSKSYWDTFLTEEKVFVLRIFLFDSIYLSS